jgi:hypothetical protein
MLNDGDTCRCSGITSNAEDAESKKIPLVRLSTIVWGVYLGMVLSALTGGVL